MLPFGRNMHWADQACKLGIVVSNALLRSLTHEAMSGIDYRGGIHRVQRES
jgi:hypothetical protein